MAIDPHPSGALRRSTATTQSEAAPAGIRGPKTLYLDRELFAAFATLCAGDGRSASRGLEVLMREALHAKKSAR